MLAVYFGSDVSKARAAAFAATSTTPAILTAETYSSGQLAESVGSVSLFSEATTYLLDTPTADATFAAETKDLLAAMAESTQQFIVIEGALLAPAKKTYQKHTTTFEEFTADKAERFNPFSMAEALVQKDKKNLWLLLQKAKIAGLSEEEIIGTLWWQLKTILLAAQTNTADEAGVKSFPYDKAKRALRVYSKEELVALSLSLLTVYHEGHAGEADIELGLEAWVLGV